MSASAAHKSRPSRQVCPLCALDDDEIVSWEPEAPGLWRYTCAKHEPPYTWLTTGQGAFDDTESVGIAEEFGVYDDLLALFPEPGPFLEWGIVEHRYAMAQREKYDDLVQRYSHTAFGPTGYSASAFLAQAAGKLARDGHLALRFVPATGYWKFNGKISSFTLAPAADGAGVLTWLEFAVSEGFDPGTWPALSGASKPKPRLVHEEPWHDRLGPKWFTADQLSHRGVCAWNHTVKDLVPATRLVITEYPSGDRDSRACCDDCYESVLRYVGRSPGG